MRIVGIIEMPTEVVIKPSACSNARTQLMGRTAIIVILSY